MGTGRQALRGFPFWGAVPAGTGPPNPLAGVFIPGTGEAGRAVAAVDAAHVRLPSPAGRVSRSAAPEASSLTILPLSRFSPGVPSPPPATALGSILHSGRRLHFHAAPGRLPCSGLPGLFPRAAQGPENDSQKQQRACSGGNPREGAAEPLRNAEGDLLGLAGKQQILSVNLKIRL